MGSQTVVCVSHILKSLSCHWKRMPQCQDTPGFELCWWTCVICKSNTCSKSSQLHPVVWQQQQEKTRATTRLRLCGGVIKKTFNRVHTLNMLVANSKWVDLSYKVGFPQQLELCQALHQWRQPQHTATVVPKQQADAQAQQAYRKCSK